jgi:hypothetical protein
MCRNVTSSLWIKLIPLTYSRFQTRLLSGHLWQTFSQATYGRPSLRPLMADRGPQPAHLYTRWRLTISVTKARKLKRLTIPVRWKLCNVNCHEKSNRNLNKFRVHVSRKHSKFSTSTTAFSFVSQKRNFTVVISSVPSCVSFILTL